MLNPSASARCALLLALFLSPQGLAAQDLETGRAAYLAGDYRVAVSVLEPLARAGDPSARIILGDAYALGNGVEQDFQRALSLYSSAEQQGMADASYKLATLLAEGRPGIPTDTAQAIVHLEEAVSQDHPAALNARAMMLVQGIGGAQDPQLAVAMLRRAHDLGSVDATANLADMLLRGEGVPRDTAAALVLLRQASARGSGRATEMLGEMYDTGIEVQQDSVAAFALYTLAAQQGDSASGWRLFEILVDPAGPRHDPGRALAWCLWAQSRTTGNGDPTRIGALVPASAVLVGESDGLPIECAKAAALLTPDAYTSARTLSLRLTQ